MTLGDVKPESPLFDQQPMTLDSLRTTLDVLERTFEGHEITAVVTGRLRPQRSEEGSFLMVEIRLHPRIDPDASQTV